MFWFPVPYEKPYFFTKVYLKAWPCHHEKRPFPLSLLQLPSYNHLATKANVPIQDGMRAKWSSFIMYKFSQVEIYDKRLDFNKNHIECNLWLKFCAIMTLSRPKVSCGTVALRPFADFMVRQNKKKVEKDHKELRFRS